MPISVYCECGKRLKAPDEAAGKMVSCPECGRVVPVPAADAPEGGPPGEYSAAAPRKLTPLSQRGKFSAEMPPSSSSRGREEDRFPFNADRPKPKPAQNPALPMIGVAVAVAVAVGWFVINRKPKDDGPEWKMFTSPEGRFSVMLPEDPSKHSQPIDVEGQKMTVHVFRSTSGGKGMVYIVEYQDFPPGIGVPPAELMLNEVKNDVLAQVLGGRVTVERDLQMAGFPGKEVKVESEVLAVNVRAYVLKDRVYQMTITGPKAMFQQVDADRALNSLQILPPPVGPAPKDGPAAKGQPAEAPKRPGIPDFKFPAPPKPPAIELPRPPQPPLGRVTPPKPRAPTQPGRKPSGEFAGHEGGIQSMAVAPKGDLLATGGDDKTVRLWSLPSGTQKARLTGHNSPVVHVAVGPDGEVASAGSPLDRNTIIIWDVDTGRPRATIPGEKRTVLALAFSPDGRYVASSHWETVKVWDAATGAEHYSKEYRPGVVHALAFSPDSKALYAGAINGTIHVIDVEKKADRATWKGHRARVSSLAFAPGGRKLLSAGVIDAKLWDVASGQPDGSFNLPARLTESAAFSPDGKRIATVANGVVHLWDADSGRELRPVDYAGRAKEALFLSDGRLAVAGSAPAVAVYAAD